MKKNALRLLFAVLVFYGNTVYSQSVRPLAAMVEKAKKSGMKAETVSLFTPLPEPQLKSDALPKELSEKMLMDLDPLKTKQLIVLAPALLELAVPAPNGEIQLELVKQHITTDDFRVTTSSGEPVEQDPGLHYRGIVKGKPETVVAISISKSGIRGLICTDEGNFNLGKLENADTYILYNDRKFNIEHPEGCSVEEKMEEKMKYPGMEGYKSEARCVRIYLEIDYDIYISSGSISTARDFVFALFNEVATLFINENIKIAASEMFVWTSPYYTGTSSADYLSAFRSYRTTFNGDLAHLVNHKTYGGRAYTNVLCNPTNAYAYSGIESGSFSSVPTYSFPVFVMAHEIGHNLGSKHTHDCVWPGGTTLDNCRPPDGGCSTGPAPVGGGTIMSQCHTTSYGVNFNKGFGPLPGNLIRDKVNSALCLDKCPFSYSGTAGGYCDPPYEIYMDDVYTNAFTLAWSGTSSNIYEVRYRLKGTTTWNFLGTSVGAWYATARGLTPSTTYEYQLRTDCDVYSTPPVWSTIREVTTLPTGSRSYYCDIKGKNSNLVWIDRVSTVYFSNTTHSDDGYGNYQRMSPVPVRPGYTGTGTSGYNTIELVPGYTMVHTRTVKVSNDVTYFWTGKKWVDQSFYMNPISYTIPGQSVKFVVPGYWKVWIDMNRDGDFVDAGELMYSNTLPSDQIQYAHITIPPSPAFGTKTTMRIAYSLENDVDPCDTNFTGEAEDYTIQLYYYGISIEPEPEEKLSGGSVKTYFRVFPNPAVGVTDIQFLQEASVGNTQLQVLDITGKVVFSKDFGAVTFDTPIETKVDLSRHSKGIYFINIHSESGTPRIQKLSLQ